MPPKANTAELDRAAINKQLAEDAAFVRAAKKAIAWFLGVLTTLVIPFIAYVSLQTWEFVRTTPQKIDDLKRKVRSTQDQVRQMGATLDTLKDIPGRVASLEREQQLRAQKQDVFSSQLSELSGYIKGLNSGSDKKKP